MKMVEEEYVEICQDSTENISFKLILFKNGTVTILQEYPIVIPISTVVGSWTVSGVIKAQSINNSLTEVLRMWNSITTGGLSNKELREKIEVATKLLDIQLAPRVLLGG